MDLVLRICDDLFFDNIWAHLVPLSAFVRSPCPAVSLNDSGPFSIFSYSSSISATQTVPLTSAWPRDYIPRQLLSLFAITSVGIVTLYFAFAWLSYKFIFNHDMMRHPRFLKNQIKLEIQSSLRAFPVMIILTLPWFQAEVMGYSKLYDDVDQYGWFYLVASVPL
jgi:lathosterol oxidase